MKRSLAATAILAAMAIAACGERTPGDAGVETDVAAVEAPSRTTEGPATAPAPTVGGSGATPAAAGAPVFAVIYPGGAPGAPATVAQGPEGPGGIVEFTTDAAPADVIDFYRQRAESAGLKAINTMNRGDSMGYAAGDGADGRGQLLSVVATRLEGEPTSVQLTWTAGR
ncbi:MAG: hypothetical protein KKG14_13835 [Alphaproteobacteria bacterium]|nr:hypothetical protein [Alphaproteobacteria bacterium]MBU2271832.1 hypothetical protein [Alphaproteobacteria bacterium]MBU2419777.1 hypothetical protein [Alphaproteobacteria bacterium]